MSQPKRTKNWSAEVTAHSDALDLEPDVFSMEDPSEIAELLKRSAEFERPSQVGRVSIGHVDAEPVHQSGGSKPVAEFENGRSNEQKRNCAGCLAARPEPFARRPFGDLHHEQSFSTSIRPCRKLAARRSEGEATALRGGT